MRRNGTGNLKAGLIGLGGIVALASLWVAASGPVYKKIAGRNRPVSETEIFQPGTYVGTARGYGGPVTVTIRVTGYEIEDVKIAAPDETPEIGMTAAEKVSKEIWLTQSHSVDSVSGATMTSNAIKKALAECFREAAKEGTELGDIVAQEAADENEGRSLPDIEELLKEIPDGTYQYRDGQDDGSGYYNVMEATVQGGKLTSVLWDMVDLAGASKRELSVSGQYVMTENGPRWDEQADALAGYVVEHQSEDGMLDESGYASDAVASVSIYAGGFADAVKKCLVSGKRQDR